MTTVRAKRLASTLGIVALGCATSTGPASALIPMVVAAGRDAAGIVSFDVEWRNAGAGAVYLPGCDHRVSMWLERPGVAGWEGFGGVVCLTNLDQSPVRVDPNGFVRAVVRVGPGSAGDYRAVTSAAAAPGGAGQFVRSATAHIS